MSIAMRYHEAFANALLLEGRHCRTFKWERDERLAFIRTYCMGGEL